MGDYVGEVTVPSPVTALCIGSGRFLRSVLVPALNASGLKTAIFQTRGRTFMDYCERQRCGEGGDSEESVGLSYEVDTVEFDGTVRSDTIAFYGAGSLGFEGGKVAALSLVDRMERISVIGVGVTEAGLASPSSRALVDLTDVLFRCYKNMQLSKLQCLNPNGRICVINTDNLPNNGNVIRSHVLEIASALDGELGTAFFKSLRDNAFASFHNTMVDRITSHREGTDGIMVPRCEPIPSKALVIEDIRQDLPPGFSASEMNQKFGVVVRSESSQLDSDIALKLRVANGTHTAAAHVMALSSLQQTTCLSGSFSRAGVELDSGTTIMHYLDAVFTSQILVGAEVKYGTEETQYVYQDWRRRLCHPYFGLSSFFITQHGAAKGGIRLAPTVRSLLLQGKDVNVSLAYAFAAILRFFTPSYRRSQHNTGVYHGWMDSFCRKTSAYCSSVPADGIVAYAKGLHFSISKGWYEFSSACSIHMPLTSERALLCDALGVYENEFQPKCYEVLVRAYLESSEGGDMEDLANNSICESSFDIFCRAVATLYARMVSGDGMLGLLREMINRQGVFVHGFESNCAVLIDAPSVVSSDSRPLHHRPCPIPDESMLMAKSIGRTKEEISAVVFAEVASTLAIDVHTHLMPPSHGALCLWGIDELLTYHYLVAEYFMTAPPSITPEMFYSRSKREQADLIWTALFIDRSPISEACRGVITVLERVGLSSFVAVRSLEPIRKFYASFRDDALHGVERFSEYVFSLSGIRYAVMTNIPFDAKETEHWRPQRKTLPKCYKSALRVDPLLAGDHATVKDALKSSGYPVSIEGARQYLLDWIDTIEPEYMMASTPHNFTLEDEGNLYNIRKSGVNEEAMQAPFAFTDITSSMNCATDCDGAGDQNASVIDEGSEFLREVLMKICEERDLPLALKIGAHRRLNPQLQAAGDGIVAFADAGILARLCTRFPRVRFLATFLSRNNQHEACVLASKFRNLHIYGCWWYCNNPSMISEITKMRVEMLGTSFTAQHSDARVLDQLIYKWSHSRAIIAQVLAEEYCKLFNSGWVATRGELRRDVQRLFGKSYEEFMSKSFK